MYKLLHACTFNHDVAEFGKCSELQILRYYSKWLPIKTYADAIRFSIDYKQCYDRYTHAITRQKKIGILHFYYYRDTTTRYTLDCTVYIRANNGRMVQIICGRKNPKELT